MLERVARESRELEQGAGVAGAVAGGRVGHDHAGGRPREDGGAGGRPRPRTETRGDGDGDGNLQGQVKKI